MLSELIEALRALEAGLVVELIVDPANTARCIGVTTYGASSLYGDDANLLDVPMVQLDVYTTDPADPLVDEVCELLAAWHQTYSVQDLNGYDPDTNRLRTILQMEAI